MKKFLGAVMAIMALSVLFTAGSVLADNPLGGLAAVGLGTYVLSHFSTVGLSGVFMAIGAIRPIKNGESNLGGNLFADIITVDQLDEPDGFYPVRGKGLLADEIPLKTGEKARRVYFDIGTLKGTSTGQGTYPNQTFIHGLTARIAGLDMEGADALDDLYQKPFIAVVTSYNKKRRIYGSLQAPLVHTVTGDTGDKPETEGGPGRMFTANALVACDFEPRYLDPTVVVELAPEPVVTP